MKTVYTLFFIPLFFFSCRSHRQEDPLLEQGIPRKLALYRKKQVGDILYKLHFDLPEKKEQPIPAQLRLSIVLHSLEHPLYLDFNEQTDHLKSLLVNGSKTAIRHEQEHLIIPQTALREGKNQIDIDFIAGDLSLNRNDDFLYTLLVPDRASTVFPCFDQPDLKAKYNLSITAPKDWKVLAGAPEQESILHGDRTEHRFGWSDQMSSYLFSFVAGKFNVAEQQVDTFRMHLLYRENNPEKVAASIAPIFDLHRQAIHFLQDYTSHPFPFQKLDFASIPIFQYGGMEHVGAIQYRESSLFLDQTATTTQLLGRAKLIAHETSHMWFGDLVTMEWFNDVWMKEVFANFMADKIANPAFPQVNHDLAFVMAHYPNAYNEDRTQGTNPIRQQLDNLKDAGSMYGGIIYDKAPIMMRQLELALGPDLFRDGLRQYLKKYAYANANWNDLVTILDEQTPLDLKRWSAVWVNEPGRPIITDHIHYTDGQIDRFEISQQAEDGSDKLWPQQFDIALIYPKEVKVLPVNLRKKQLDLKEAKGLTKPLAILYNYSGLGYGVFPTDSSAQKLLPTIKNEVARGYGYINSYENMLNGNISPKELFTLLCTGLTQENNELVLRQITGNLNSLFWHFFSQEDRSSLQASLENLLYQQLQAKRSPNIKKTLFGLFSSIAYSDKGKALLYEIWQKKLTIPDLRLNEDDYTGLAMKLALFQHPQREEILKEARAAITNPDNQQRFAFLLPALSADEKTRRDFFESFKEEKNREKEDWVLSACELIHHPLRQQSAIHQLPLALELTEEIQRTGDIFFPKRWLSSTLGNYSSEEAYTIFEEFIKAHPQFNPILKNKLLQAGDDLVRAHRLRRTN